MPESVLAILVAVLGGAAVGIERQWSGHASGPRARFGGIRTFSMLGALAGLSGHLWSLGAQAPSAVLLALAGAIVATGYAVAARQDVDATTEVAALVVLAAGVTAGLGEIEIASGVIAVTALLLFEKSRLHQMVLRFEGDELTAAFRFAVMAVVVLPLLPEGPFGPLGGIRPRQLWLLVLFFSGLSFAGYVARRLVGASRGYVVAGLLGGLVSSTSVTLTLSKVSREGDVSGRALADGVIAANTMAYARVVVAAAVLSPGLALALWPVLTAPFVIGLAAVAVSLLRRQETAPDSFEGPRNPLELRSALEMAALFQVVLFIVHLARQELGSGGVVATAALVGLTDADALTLSMATSVRSGSLEAMVGAQAIGVGLLSNTCVKAALAAGIGRGAYRLITVGVLAAMGVALAAGAWLR
ncbi:MAG: MgtC/SapB family protein [Vicinamibacterales bacterium]